MGDLLADGLLLPAAVLAFLAWLVPKLLSFVVAEGVRPLIFLTFISSLILYAVSASFFFLLYLWNGMPLEDIAAFGWRANIVFFGRLGLIAALIWAPVMILSVAGIPRTWTKETW